MAPLVRSRGYFLERGCNDSAFARTERRPPCARNIQGACNVRSIAAVNHLYKCVQNRLLPLRTLEIAQIRSVINIRTGVQRECIFPSMQHQLSTIVHNCRDLSASPFGVRVVCRSPYIPVVVVSGPSFRSLVHRRDTVGREPPPEHLLVYPHFAVIQ